MPCLLQDLALEDHQLLLSLGLTSVTAVDIMDVVDRRTGRTLLAEDMEVKRSGVEGGMPRAAFRMCNEVQVTYLMRQSMKAHTAV